MKVVGSFECSNHEIVELRILHGRNKAISGIAILDFRRANFDIFKDLLAGIPSVTALEGKGVQENWLIFQYQKFV